MRCKFNYKFFFFFLLFFMVILKDNAYSKNISEGNRTYKMTAKYRPNGTGKPEFINTTKCVTQKLFNDKDDYFDPCRPDNIISSDTVIAFNYINVWRYPKYNGSIRDGIFYMRHSGNKFIPVINKSTGDYAPVVLYPTSLGGLFKSNEHTLRWPYLKSDCSIFGTPASYYPNTGKGLFFVWRFPNDKEVCFSRESDSTQYVPIEIDRIFYGFKMKFPLPDKLGNGIYTGEVKLLVAPNGDIDMGNGNYSGTFTIQLELDVKHELKVKFLDDIEKVILKPDKGWHNKSTGLSSKVSYALWASSDVRVYAYCQYRRDGTCGIKNKIGHLVPLDIFNVESGKEKVLLKEGIPQIIKITNPEIGKKRDILFSVDKSHVDIMRKFPGLTYSGDVTIIFDASL